MTAARQLPRAAVAWFTALGERLSRHQALVLLVGTGVTAGALGLLVASPRTLRPSHQYAVGDFATSTIRAPWDLSIRDEVSTARMRDEAARHAPPVASFDTGPSTTLPARVAEVFGRARELIAKADQSREVPAADLAKLSAAGRRRAQQTRERDADKAVQTTVQDMLGVLELELHLALPPDERTLLESAQFDRRIEDGLLALLREAYSRPLARSVRQIRDVAARSQPPGETPRLILRAGASTPDRLLQDAAILDDVTGAVSRMRARVFFLAPDLSGTEQQLLVGLASRLIIPDTAYDEAATAQRRTRAAAGVLPISLNFARNQLIVGEGREVTREALLVLDYLRQQALPQAFLARAAGVAALTWVLLASVLLLPSWLAAQPLSLRDGVFVLAALVAATAAFWLWMMLADGVSVRAPGVPRLALVLLFPATAVPMLAGLVLPRRLSGSLVAAVAIATGLLIDLGILLAAHTLVVGLIGSQLVARCRQRSGVIRAGVSTGAAAVVSGVGVLALAGSGGGVGPAAAAVAGAFLGAASGGLVALAFSRPVEWVFGFSTRLGLGELLSYDHRLLRRFMERAPGTFEHSVAVAQLARAAAETIGADALLVRVGALYHDVGKMEEPQFFTENQRDQNPHDAMAPQDSARVVLDHVARGVRLLREHGMGERLADFVREHQGTGALTIFQRKARESGQAADPADFRYPGPRPRSRETAVLMMADKIEATARSRGAATRDEFRAIVEETIDGLQATRQLDESPLTLRDLAMLRQTLVSALVDLYHKRVDYPRPAASAGSVPPIPAEQE